MKKNNKGFSLVELIIVIAIMAVLVAVLAPQYIKYVEKSRVTTDENTVAEVIRATQTAMADPTVYEALAKGSFTVTVSQSTTGDAATSGIAGTAVAALTDEVESVVGNINLKSKTYGDKTYTINITYDADASAYTVAPYAVGNWA